jgi:hypothetical protein
MTTQDTYLHAGDVIAYAGQCCHVLRVNDCAAVVALPQRPRTFTTRWGKIITIQPGPKRERISPNSCVPIIHRNK